MRFIVADQREAVALSVPKDTAAGGTLKLAGARTHVLKVFQITRLAEVIPLYESVDAACV